jgi:hypothetical protein
MKIIASSASAAALLIAISTPAGAGPIAVAKALSRSVSGASVTASRQCPTAPHDPLAALLLPVRDVRAAGGGGGNGCWSACFTDFDECMGIRAKNQCVSRVKTCLETCDRLSNRPGM